MTNYPNQVSAGESGHVSDHNAITTDLLTAKSRAGGVVSVDEPQFTGTDDQRVAAAMSYAAAQTVPPQIQFSAKSYTLNNAYPLFDGCAWIGTTARGNAELSGNKGCVKTTIHANYSGVFLDGSAGGAYNSGYVMDLSIRNIMFVGSNSGTQWLGCGSSGALHGSEIREVGCTGFHSVLGSQSQKLGFTTSIITDFDVNNSSTGGIHIGGSDNVFFFGHCNIDSPTSMLSTYSSTGQYHVWFDFCEKTAVGPFYITCEGGWQGIKVSGPTNPATDGGNGNNGGPIWIRGAKVEGRNAGAPCSGANVRVEGGILVLSDSWVSYGMNSPSGLGHPTQDAGMIHHSGGTLNVSGVTYDRATGIAESVPFVYRETNAEDTMVTRISRGSKGGSWTGRPQIHAASGSFLISDATVSVV